jgi:hypothetical protein
LTQLLPHVSSSSSVCWGTDSGATLAPVDASVTAAERKVSAGAASQVRRATPVLMPQFGTMLLHALRIRRRTFFSIVLVATAAAERQSEMQSLVDAQCPARYGFSASF